MATSCPGTTFGEMDTSNSDNNDNNDYDSDDVGNDEWRTLGSHLLLAGPSLLAAVVAVSRISGENAKTIMVLHERCASICGGGGKY